MAKNSPLPLQPCPILDLFLVHLHSPELARIVLDYVLDESVIWPWNITFPTDWKTEPVPVLLRPLELILFFPEHRLAAKLTYTHAAEWVTSIPLPIHWDSSHEFFFMPSYKRLQSLNTLYRDPVDDMPSLFSFVRPTRPVFACSATTGGLGQSGHDVVWVTHEGIWNIQAVVRIQGKKKPLITLPGEMVQVAIDSHERENGVSIVVVALLGSKGSLTLVQKRKSHKGWMRGTKVRTTHRHPWLSSCGAKARLALSWSQRVVIVPADDSLVPWTRHYVPIPFSDFGDRLW